MRTVSYHPRLRAPVRLKHRQDLPSPSVAGKRVKDRAKPI